MAAAFDIGSGIGADDLEYGPPPRGSPYAEPQAEQHSAAYDGGGGVGDQEFNRLWMIGLSSERNL